MKTVVIHVIGRTQKVGYRTRVIGYAHSLNVNGYVRNLPDGRVEIVAQASEDIIKMFIDSINIRDPLIHIDDIKTKYTDEFEGFTDFHKIVGPNETDERLDSAVDHLKILINKTDNMTETLKGILESNNEIVNELRGLRGDNSEKVMNEIKEAVTNEVHIMQEELVNKIQKIETILKDSIKQS